MGKIERRIINELDKKFLDALVNSIIDNTDAPRGVMANINGCRCSLYVANDGRRTYLTETKTGEYLYLFTY